MNAGKGVMYNGKHFEATSRRKTDWSKVCTKTETRREARQIIVCGIWVVLFSILQAAETIPDATAYSCQILSMLYCCTATVLNRTPGCFMISAGMSGIIWAVLQLLPLNFADYIASVYVLLFSILFLVWGGVIGSAGWIAIATTNLGCSLLGWEAVPLELVGVLTWAGVFFSAYSTVSARKDKLKRLQKKRELFHAKKCKRDAEIMDSYHESSAAFNGVLYAASDFCKKSPKEKAEMLERCTMRFNAAKRAIIGDTCVHILEAMRKVMRGEI